MSKIGQFLGITVKSWPRVGAWTDTLNPTKCLWRSEPDCRSNFFIPPANLCAVTYITEILLYVTLSNQSHSITQIYHSPTVGPTSSSVRLHICAVTYMTEISLIPTLNNQFTIYHSTANGAKYARHE